MKCRFKMTSQLVKVKDINQEDKKVTYFMPSYI